MLSLSWEQCTQTAVTGPPILAIGDRRSSLKRYVCGPLHALHCILNTSSLPPRHRPSWCSETPLMLIVMVLCIFDMRGGGDVATVVVQAINYCDMICAGWYRKQGFFSTQNTSGLQPWTRELVRRIRILFNADSGDKQNHSVDREDCSSKDLMWPPPWGTVCLMSSFTFHSRTITTFHPHGVEINARICICISRSKFW